MLLGGLGEVVGTLQGRFRGGVEDMFGSLFWEDMGSFPDSVYDMCWRGTHVLNINDIMYLTELSILLTTFWGCYLSPLTALCRHLNTCKALCTPFETSYSLV